MELINRSQLILKPSDCLKKRLAYDDTNDWNHNNYVFLVPDLPDEQQCIAYLKAQKRYQKVFDIFKNLEFNEKVSFEIDTSCFQTFLKCFEIEYHGMIFDVVDDYLSINTPVLTALEP